jgi:DNA-binding NarL/FixJ family response regulator
MDSCENGVKIISKAEPYRIVLVDDHVLFRQGLRRILEEMADLEIVGEASDSLELIDLLNRLALSQLTPHMVVLDISMPRLRGIEAIHRVKGLYPEVKVLILTMHKEVEYLHQAIGAGAEGYVLKENTNVELFSAIKMIRLGGVYFSPLISGNQKLP